MLWTTQETTIKGKELHYFKNIQIIIQRNYEHDTLFIEDLINKPYLNGFILFIFIYLFILKCISL